MTANESGLSFWGDGESLKLDSGGGGTTLGIY